MAAQHKSVSKPQPKHASAKAHRGWLRWLLMFVLFIYLFSLAMTLVEVDAFQTLVGQLSRPSDNLSTQADQLRLREVLQAVRVAGERAAADDVGAASNGNARGPAPRAGQEPLLADVARHVDELRGAVAQFEAMTPRLEFAVIEVSPARQNAAASQLLTRITGLSEKLAAHAQACTGDIDADRPECVLEQAQTGRLREVKRQADELAGYLGRLATGEAAEPESRENLLEAKATVDAIAGALDSFEAEIAAADQALDESFDRKAAAVAKDLESLRQSDVKLLKRALVRADTPPETNGPLGIEREAPPTARQFVQFTGAENRNTPALRNALMVYAASEGLSWTDASLESAAGFRDAIRVLQDRERTPGGADGRYGRDTATTLNAAVARVCRGNENPDCAALEVVPTNATGELAAIGDTRQRPGMAVVQRQLGQVAAALRVLGSAVDDGDDALADRAAVYGALADLDLAALRLGSVQVRQPDAAPGAGAALSVDGARKEYDEALVAVTQAVGMLRTSLDDRDVLAPIIQAIGEDDPQVHRKAVTILREYLALDEYGTVLKPLAFFKLNGHPCNPDESNGGQPSSGVWAQTLRHGCGLASLLTPVWNRLVTIGFSAQGLATKPRQALDIMVVVVMGAIGALIYMIRYLLSKALQGIEPSSALWRPLTWYVFRPIFGMVVAFAIFLLYKTGQIALGGGSGDALVSEVNLPILSVFSLFAGLLSWQALELVESKGRRWLAEQTRDNLWAVGLESALRTAGKSRADLAAQVDVSQTQVDRWIGCQDKVTPEMQDRILTWLNRSRVDIFSDEEPTEQDNGALAWAVGVKEALEHNPAVGDVPHLAQLIGREVSTVQAWVDLHRQVPADAQYAIRDKLGTEWALLFSRELPDAGFYAVGLRKALGVADARHSNAASLAQAIGSSAASIHGYMELRLTVPKLLRERIADALGLDAKGLFSVNRPLDAQFQWAPGLRRCMRSGGARYDSASLAKALDTEQAYVREWMELARCGEDDAPYCGQLAPDTQDALQQLLGCDRGALFRGERGDADFRWAHLPALAQAIGGDIGGWAQRLDVPPGQVERWLVLAESIAPPTQEALLADLNVPIELRADYFTDRPPRQPDTTDGQRWAVGLRKAVRARPGLTSLSALADRLQVPVTTIYDIADLLLPVERELRERMHGLLGPATADGTPLFTAEPPDWTAYRWAPGLRAALDEAGLDASMLAQAIDTDVALVRDWMEQQHAVRPSAAPGDGLARGQVPPALQQPVVDAINGARAPSQMEVRADAVFAATRAERGALFARRPALEVAIAAQNDGGMATFAAQVDVDPALLARWLAQEQAVLRPSQDAILAALGVTDSERSQLFTDAQGIDAVIG